MENPKELKYTKEHEWVKVEEDNVVIGVTDFAQHLLTDIVFVELPEMGKEIEQGKPFMVIESVKSVSDVYASVSGKISKVNEDLQDNSGLVNDDPFGRGWLVKVKIKDAKEIDKLMSAEEYEKFCKEEENK
ncbi:MAG: glycine cleavage system protein GcvH [Candidatus Woesearchaeota archaeon]|jgi:glycine cleavage system H protein|nr:glycine cleavage system protein H [archaeon]MDP6547950.1 glycine cleavage system protein GcvH [Candidatus Woesearchaeota archaeon]MDP7263644.1 glycine cleavage system protein GcvH [Candidatus Woesearchaeota archaeon]MDP7622629.1 glycine cleavage system protein GcvH [Candidatus Woesearchaeota archaeon]HJN57337.1 glycine cleavage system protein GcvH [Candidatus Woesearchaeota archaeon]|tara:strand:- start:20454 stop:20846 length:393 start_codon:yes stop_codon:yes gene_type:complete